MELKMFGQGHMLYFMFLKVQPALGPQWRDSSGALSYFGPILPHACCALLVNVKPFCPYHLIPSSPPQARKAAPLCHPRSLPNPFFPRCPHIL
eukprot:366573-Chlamydomonas_euryale.AAC.49